MNAAGKRGFRTANDGELEYVKINQPYPPDTEGKKYTETLSVVSEGGYVINFIFHWNNNTLRYIRCMPLINPYSCGQIRDKNEG